ncbi:MAG: hypothetical protein VKL60_20690, partial [Sphaerospermopsis sp.]|nr:hypothetical protein [Sphaerospermopsis sp.]
ATATFTNDTMLSNLAVNAKKILNKEVQGLGDFFIPFAKVPSNAIDLGLKYSGGGAVGGMKNIFKFYKNRKTLSDVEGKRLLKDGLKDLVRVGFGASAVALTGFKLFKDTEFIGAYDKERSQIEELKNGTYDAVKIGGKWINLDYLGPLKTPLVAGLYMKKYGKDLGLLGAATQGVGSLIGSFKTSPFFEGMNSLVESAKDLKKGEGAEQYVKALARSASDFTARYIPSAIGQAAILFDSYKRDTKKFYGFGKVIDKIPWLRKIMLDPKINGLGQEIKLDWFDRTLPVLFGSRVKIANDNPIAKEYERLDETGNTPSFENWDYPRKKILQGLKANLTEDEYRSARVDFGEALTDNLEKLFNSEEYKKMDDFDKKKAIADATSDATTGTALKLGFDKDGQKLGKEVKLEGKSLEYDKMYKKGYDFSKSKDKELKDLNKSMSADRTKNFKLMLQYNPEEAKKWYNDQPRKEKERLKSLIKKDEELYKVFTKIK